MHIHQNSIGKPRVYCGSKARGFDCESKSTFLEVYEAQIQWYLENFIIPEDYKEKIIEAHRKLLAAYDDTINRQNTLERRLQKIKELYQWGHMSKDEYLADYSEIQKELKILTMPDDKGKTLEKLAHFLANVAEAWKEETQEQRNKRANVLLEEIWIEDNKVVAIKPRDELRPFFQLSYEEHLKKSNKRPRGDLNPHVHYIAYLLEILSPLIPKPIVSRHKLPVTLSSELALRHRTESLRALAKDYGVSYESVRRALTSAKSA